MEWSLFVSNNIADRSVAANVRAEIARAGVSQSSVAEALGISKAGLSRRMNGHLSFRVSELVAICDLIGISPHTLMSSGTSARAHLHADQTGIAS